MAAEGKRYSQKTRTVYCSLRIRDKLIDLVQEGARPVGISHKDPQLLHITNGSLGIGLENRLMGERRDTGAYTYPMVQHPLKYLVILCLFLCLFTRLGQHKVAEYEYHPVATVIDICYLIICPF